MSRQQSTGECYLCRQHFAKGLMTRHLIRCSPPGSLAEPPQTLPAQAMHLIVEGRWAKDYWIHLAVPTTAPLRKLDDFLRAIWLECCGHLSAFEICGVRYGSSPMEEEESMRTPLSRVVDVGTKLLYEYDYGSTTALNLKVVGFRGAAATSKNVELLARNDPPQISCAQCGAQPATLICTGCDGFWLCQPCSEEHRCGEDYLLPNVNSPRVGVCGYSG